MTPFEEGQVAEGAEILVRSLYPPQHAGSSDQLHLLILLQVEPRSNSSLAFAHITRSLRSVTADTTEQDTLQLDSPDLWTVRMDSTQYVDEF